jgi:hypothetical protein
LGCRTIIVVMSIARLRGERMTASGGTEDKREDGDDAEEAAPDSSVRPTMPPPSRGGVAIGSIRGQAQSTMSVTLSVSVSPGLMASGGEGGWYLTVARTDGPLLFEGFLDELGTLDVVVTIPCGTRAIKALLESATTYRDAVVAVGDNSRAEHTFF